MTLPDISELTISELRELVAVATAAFRAAEQAEQAEQEVRRAQISAAITTLETLLGPVDGEAGVDSIRAVRRYDEQTMGENAGLALNLAFNGLEQLTTTVLNLAYVIEGK